MTAALAERLRPVHDVLAEMERAYLLLARTDNEPDVWATWCDMHAALMAVRAAQGRDARGRCYHADVDAGGDMTPTPVRRDVA